MSRAFVREDADGEGVRRHYHLPPRDDPGYEAAAANARATIPNTIDVRLKLLTASSSS